MADGDGAGVAARAIEADGLSDESLESREGLVAVELHLRRGAKVSRDDAARHVAEHVAVGALGAVRGRLPAHGLASTESTTGGSIDGGSERPPPRK